MSKRDQRIQRAMDAACRAEDRLRALADAQEELFEIAYVERRRARDRRFERIVAGLQVTPPAQDWELTSAELQRIENRWASRGEGRPYQGPQNNLSPSFYGDAPDPGTMANRHAAFEVIQSRRLVPWQDPDDDHNVSPFGLKD